MFVLPLLLLLAGHCSAWRQMAFVCCRWKCAFVGEIIISKLWLSPPSAPSQEMTSIKVRLVTMAMPCLRMIVKLSFIHCASTGFLFCFALSACIILSYRSVYDVLSGQQSAAESFCSERCVFVHLCLCSFSVFCSNFYAAWTENWSTLRAG